MCVQPLVDIAHAAAPEQGRLRVREDIAPGEQVGDGHGAILSWGGGASSPGRRMLRRKSSNRQLFPLSHQHVQVGLGAGDLPAQLIDGVEDAALPGSFQLV